MSLRHLIIFVFILLLSLIISCTNNPLFGDKDTAQDKRVISGRILLNDGTQPDDIYVWIEDLNISDRTNSNGDFRLQIPRTDEFAGLNGAYTVYFYVGNYEFNTASILIVNGEFVYGKYDISSDGRLNDTITLKKLLDVSTSSQPVNLFHDNGGALNVSVFVMAVDSSVSVISNRTKDGVFGSIALEKIGTPISEAILLNLDKLHAFENLIQDTVIWNTQMVITPGSIMPGTYHVRPYFKVRQDELPPELIESFGVNADRFTYNYIKIPYKQRLPILIVN